MTSGIGLAVVLAACTPRAFQPKDACEQAPGFECYQKVLWNSNAFPEQSFEALEWMWHQAVLENARMISGEKDVKTPATEMLYDMAEDNAIPAVRHQAREYLKALYPHTARTIYQLLRVIYQVSPEHPTPAQRIEALQWLLQNNSNEPEIVDLKANYTKYFSDAADPVHQFLDQHVGVSVPLPD